MYLIDKEIHFCYGHRLLNHSGKCRHLHGHNAVAVIQLAATELDEMGMVCDFSEIGAYVKRWVDDNLDHTMLLHRDDPVLPCLEQSGERVVVMDANPTAENIARMIYEHVVAGGYPVTRVTLHETSTAQASYQP